MNNLGKLEYVPLMLAWQAWKNRPSERPERCLKLRGRIHTVPVTSHRTSVFFWTAEPQFCPKTPYFKTQSYLLLVCLQLREPVFTKELSPILIHLIRLRICYSNEILIFQSEEFYWFEF